MLLSKTTEYALRVLIYIANHEHCLCSAKLMHQELNIPYKYLTGLLTDLSKKDYLVSVKGREGGFKLAKSPDRIFLANIIDAVEGMERFNSCILGFETCSSEHPCAMHSVWEVNKQQLLKTFEQTSLRQLIVNESKGVKL